MLYSLRARQGVTALLTTLFAVFVAACTTLPDNPQPIQSPNDDRAYRLLTLENQMQVLLVSNPDTQKAAASLDVLVGSGENPEGRGGLAHFLEHMLFLGTDKYPDPGEYERYITEHGGTRNAYTSFEHTNYFFDIDQPYLEEGLDRFAQFFIAPRFDVGYVEREKHAVEAEFQMGLKSDPRRGLDVLQETMDPAHPFSQFSVGSLETLADRPDSAIRDELLAFYERHYSANMMRLSVYGSQSLDELEAMVVPLFSQVPNKSIAPQIVAAPLFSPDSLPMLVKVKPQAAGRRLEISFPTAEFRDQYQAKPLSYVGNLVGHEGEGSLLAQLKAEGLAESLAAGSGLSWRGGGLFGVSITLTREGVESYERVLQLVFAYLDMLREKGPQQWLFEEQAQQAALSFRFQEDADAMSYVRGLASGMHYYQPRDVLRGPYIMDNYRQDLINEALDDLRPGNARVTLTAVGVETDRVSKHYEVPYALHPVSSEMLARWHAPVEDGLFTLPEPNQFIARDVSLRPLAEGAGRDPVLLLEKHRQNLWYAQDSEFRVPRGATFVNFKSSLVGEAPRHVAATALYVALLKDAVNEYTYPALLAGLSFDLYKHAQGVSLRISGYDDKQPVLLRNLVDDIIASQFEQQRFDNIRRDIIRSLEDTRAARPSSQVMADLREALQHGQWGEQALIAELQSMTLADLERFAALFWATVRADIMVYGNYDADDAAVVSSEVARLLGPEDVPATSPLRVVKLAAGDGIRYPVDVPHDDVVVAWYLQGADESWRDRAAASLTAQIMKSGFYQQLRTEQQLGYIVSAFYYPQLDVPGVLMLVQSPVADAEQVSKAMDEFMRGVPADLDEAQFERHRIALLGDVLEPDKNLWERAEFYWQSIAKDQLDFRGRENLASAIKELGFDDWLAYYRQVFLQERRSLQVVAPGKPGVLPRGAADPAASAQQIKDTHDVYEMH